MPGARASWCMESDSAPGKAGYWVGAALIVAAVGLAIWWVAAGFMNFTDEVDGFERIPIPGAAVLQLESGKSAVYHEARSTGGDRTAPGLNLSVRNLQGERAPKISRYGASVTYDVNGRSGIAVWTVDAPEAGRYRVRVTSPSSEAAGTEIAVGRPIGSRIVRIVVGGAAIFVLGAGIGTAAIVLTAVRRRRAARA